MKVPHEIKGEEWQNVRRGLVGNWNLKPEWCCEQLKEYLGNISNTTNNKLKIVMNYLTGSGFRMGKIKNPCINTLRGQISAEIKIRKMSDTWK